MTLQGVIYSGPPLEKSDKLQALPSDLIEILWQVNGFVAYAGGLHFRGLVDQPQWHSFEHYHSGEMALHKLFRQVKEYDAPFGQDYLGNQFLLRDHQVFRLRADTGEVTSLKVDLAGFLDKIRDDPVGYLSLELLATYQQEHGVLEPGQLLHTMPPLCLKRPEKNVAVRAVPADNAVAFLANFARQISDVPDGTQVDLRMFEPPPGEPVQ